MATWEECNQAIEKIIPPTGKLEITENGTYGVSGYYEVDVNVSGGSSTVRGTFKGEETGTLTLKLPYSGNGYPIGLLIGVKDGTEVAFDDLPTRGYLMYTSWKNDTGAEPEYVGGADDTYNVTFSSRNSANVLGISVKAVPLATDAVLVDDSNTAKKAAFRDAKTLDILIKENEATRYGFIVGVEYEYTVIYKEVPSGEAVVGTAIVGVAIVA